MSCRRTHMEPSRSTHDESRRGHVTAVACEACRKRRSKVCSLHPSDIVPDLVLNWSWLTSREFTQCDGERPTCSGCASRGASVCVYEPEIDGSRTKYLRQQNRVLQTEVVHLRERLAAQPEELPKDELAPHAASPDSQQLKIEDELCSSSPSVATTAQEGAIDRNEHFSPRSVDHSHLLSTKHLTLIIIWN